MKDPVNLEQLKLALRDQLCTDCEQRPAADHTPAPQSPACETDCTLFHNLPRLAQVAKAGEPPCGYDVFAKSLDAFAGDGNALDVPRALSIIESAEQLRPPFSSCATPGGCARAARIDGAIACHYSQPRVAIG